MLLLQRYLGRYSAIVLNRRQLAWIGPELARKAVFFPRIGDCSEEPDAHVFASAFFSALFGFGGKPPDFQRNDATVSLVRKFVTNFASIVVIIISFCSIENKLVPFHKLIECSVDELQELNPTPSATASGPSASGPSAQLTVFVDGKTRSLRMKVVTDKQLREKWGKLNRFLGKHGKQFPKKGELYDLSLIMAYTDADFGDDEGSNSGCLSCFCKFDCCLSCSDPWMFPTRLKREPPKKSALGCTDAFTRTSTEIAISFLFLLVILMELRGFWLLETEALRTRS
jgi:hypothetical protein